MPRKKVETIDKDLKTKKKSTSNSKTVATSKAANKKAISKKNTEVAKTSKKAATKRSMAKKTTAKKVATKKITKKISKKNNKVLEYYDLPFTYNKTFVRILAQTPNTLFVYWEISEDDKKAFIKKHGKDFFENTRPVLIVHNKTKNYTFEIEINDFANSWYFNVNDAKCEYEIELGRRTNTYISTIPNNYMYITSSNDIEAPNDHILFEKELKQVFFKNTKTNNVYSKDIINLQFMKHLGNIRKIYNTIYKIDGLNNIENNPSSNFTSF